MRSVLDRLPWQAALILGVGVSMTAAFVVWPSDLPPPPAPVTDAAPDPDAWFLLDTIWSPREGFERAQPLLRCLREELGEQVGLRQRHTCAESNALLLSGGADLGLVCPVAAARPMLREAFGGGWRLSGPEGDDVRRSVLIVRADHAARGLDDLRGASVAWVEPDSLTGALAVRLALADRGEDPDGFFGRLRYSHGHERSLELVLRGSVDAAAIDERVLDRAAGEGAPVRSVWTSPTFPGPLLVVDRARPELAAAVERVAHRPQCLEPLGGTTLRRVGYEDYEALVALLEAGR